METEAALTLCFFIKTHLQLTPGGDFTCERFIHVQSEQKNTNIKLY